MVSVEILGINKSSSWSIVLRKMKLFFRRGLGTFVVVAASRDVGCGYNTVSL